MLGRKVVAGGAVVDVQAHARQLGAQAAQAFDEGIAGHGFFIAGFHKANLPINRDSAPALFFA